MRSIVKAASAIAVSAALFLVLNGCSEEKSSSLYDPSFTNAPPPAITSVTPAGSAVAGIDTVVIQGTGFSATLGDNDVVFNATEAQLISATATSITMIAPLLVSDSVVIRAAVHGSLEYSNEMSYVLKPAVIKYGSLQEGEKSGALTNDSAGILYAGISLNNLEAGVIAVSTAGVRTTYAPKTGGDWTGMKMGAGGYLYAVRNIRAVFRFAPGGGAAAGSWVAMATGIFLDDIDFDQNGDMWCGGNNPNIYRIKSDKTVTTFAFTGDIHSLRVYNGYLYMSVTSGGAEKIMRAAITGSGLGTPEEYYDLSTQYPGTMTNAITFSSDGDLFMGVNSEKGIIVVRPDKSSYSPWTVYKQLFGTGVAHISWGAVDDLYCSTLDGTLLKINVTGKVSAPYYGRGL